MSRTIAISLVFAVFAGLLGCQTTQETQTPSEKMLREFFATWSPEPDVDKLLSYFTDDCVCENMPREKAYRGKDGVRAYVKATYDAIPDFKVEAIEVFVSGEWAACEWVMTGTQFGVTEEFPGTGKSFKVRGSSIVQLKDGKIQRLSDYWDRGTFLRQVGLSK